jgi:hypothetical protein
VSHLSHIPIATEVYQKIMPVYEIALGVYYQSSYYVAKAPIYKSETVFFERFCYDFVSLLGVNILFLEIEQLELIIRKVYSHVSYNFSGMNEDGGIQLRDYECIDSAFQEEVFVKVKQEMKKQSQVKIEVLNQRKNSEDDFADKVAAEKGQKDDDETESAKSYPKSPNEEKTSNSNNLFAGMMNVDNVLADKARKKEEKKQKMDEMNRKKEKMRPFILFNSIKDNPLPYEQKYI